MSVGSEYTQLYLPDPYIPYVGGLCEGYVEGTAEEATFPYKDKNNNWTTAGVYPTAIAAWNAGNGNHPNELPPAGLRVALHFALGNNKAGHTALQLEDGRVASSTQAGWHPTGYIHPNLADLIKVYTKANGSCTYLGWTEWIGRKQIVSKGDEMIPDNDNDYNRWALTSKYVRSRVDGNNQLVALTREEFRKSAVGKTWLEALEILEDSTEAEGTLVTLQTGEDAQKGDWVGQIKSLQGVVIEKDKQIAALEKEIAEGSGDFIPVGELFIRKDK